MRIGAKSAVAVIAVLLLVSLSEGFAQTWTRTSMLRGVTSVASSADGSKLVAVGDTLILRSTNSGLNWYVGSIVGSPFVSRWVSVSASSDGTRMVAARYVAQSSEGGIFTSSDSGVTWTKTTAPTNVEWRSLASSADGSFLVAAGYDRGIYVSDNSGTNWLRTGAIAARWNSVAASANGRRLLATAEAIGPALFASPDYGYSWLPLTNAPPLYRGYVGSSANGGRLVAAVSVLGGRTGYTNDGTIQISGDLGASWREAAVPTRNWSSVAVSANGSRMIASVAGGGLYTSRNSGASWTADVAPNLDWSSVASSADGSKLVAAAKNDGIYVLQESTPVRVSLGVLDANPLHLESVLLPQPVSASLLQTLTSASTTRFQAAADGLTKLLLRCESDRPGTVTFDLENVALGMLAQIDGSPLTSEIPTSQVGSKHVAFALYTVPDQAREDDNIVSFAASFTAADSFAQAAAEVKLVQTPVVLVHGLWGDDKTWEQMAKSLVNVGVEARKAVYWDSTNNAAARFSAHRGVVWQKARSTVRALRASGIAVTQGDIVAHSMGGILARIDSNNPDSHREENWGKGYFRRVVTVNSPHWGTPAATFLFRLSQLSIPFRAWAETAGVPMHLGAVNDLSAAHFAANSGGESSAARMPLACPSVAITTYCSAVDFGFLGLSFLYVTGRDQAARLNPEQKNQLAMILCGREINGFDDLQAVADKIFSKKANDGVVLTSSQIGGCERISSFSTVEHTYAPKSPDVQERIIQLLRATHTAFAVDGFPAVTEADLGSQECQPVLSVEAYPHLVSGTMPSNQETGARKPLMSFSQPSTNATAHPGDIVDVLIRPLDGVALEHLTVTAKLGDRAFGDDSLSPGIPVGSGILSNRIQIPKDFVGSATIIALGIDNNGDYDLQKRVINVVPSQDSSIQSIRVSSDSGDTDLLISQLSVPQPLKVSGVYSDGVERDVTAADTGTSYGTSDSSVALVDAEGGVTAVANGAADITVMNGTATAKVSVLVDLQPPELLSIEPGHVQPGSKGTKIILVGDNLGGISEVEFLREGKPDASVVVESITANRYNVEVVVNVGINAASGLLTVVAKTPVGSSTNQPGQGNRLFIGSPIRLNDVGVEEDGSGSRLKFRVVGSSGSGFVIQRSSNLQTWISITTNSLRFGVFDFVESVAQSPFGSRYYRAVLLSE